MTRKKQRDEKIIHVVFGPGGGRVDEFEDITVREISLSKLAQLADQGGIKDAKTLLLAEILRLRRPDLFE